MPQYVFAAIWNADEPLSPEALAKALAPILASPTNAPPAEVTVAPAEQPAPAPEAREAAPEVDVTGMTPYLVEDTRYQERAALRLLKRDGAMTLGTFHRRLRMVPKAIREEALYDLHRLGLIALYDDDSPKGKGRRYVAITPGVTLPSLIEP